MAVNRYSQLTQTPYVSQYVPAPTNQFAQLAKQSRDRFEQAKLQDAETRALAMRTLGTASTPEERQMVEKIVRPAIEDLDQRAQEGNYHDALLEAQTQGLETTSRIESLKNARQQRQQMKEDFLENNPDVDPQELEYRLQRNMPSLQFDEETRYVGLGDSGLSEQLAPDVNLTNEVSSLLSGLKAQGVNTRARYDEERGFFVNQEGDRISRERARNLANMAIEGNREAQNYLNRREEYHTMQAEDSIQQGGNPVSNLIKSYENVDTEVADRVRRQVNDLRDRGFDDAQIYGRLMRNNELNNAIGFGESKYAFSDIKEGLRSPRSAFTQRLEEMGKSTDADYLRTGLKANPWTAGLDEEFDFTSSILGFGSRGESSVSQQSGLVPLYDEEGNITNDPAKAAASYIKNTPVNDMIEGIEDERTRETMKVVREHVPRQEGESKQDYLDRLSKGYENYVKGYKNTQGVAKKFKNNDERVAKQEELFGDPDDPSVGTADTMTFYDITPDGNYQPMTMQEAADYYGYETKKDFANALALQGQFEEDDGIASGGSYATVPMESGTGDYIPFNEETITGQVKISPNSIEEEREMGVRSRLQRFKLDPSMRETEPFYVGERGEGGEYDIVEYTPRKEVFFVGPDGNEVSADHPDATPKVQIILEGSNGKEYIGTEDNQEVKDLLKNARQ